jgi:hypothetical protein
MGPARINFLVLAIAYRSIALPVFGSVLDKAGNSKSVEMAIHDEIIRSPPIWQLPS